jgi:hypothetical protein
MYKRIAVFALASAFACISLNSEAAVVVNIDFDTDGNWTAGSGSITSYQSDHVYADQGMLFTGGRALRQGNGLQDGVAGALGTFAWRLDDGESVPWTATYADVTAGDAVSGFSFAVRRWDGNPSPAFDISYSLDGGTNFTSVGTIDNTFLGDTSDWATFSHNFGLSTVADGDLVVQLSSSTGERIMVDNFSLTAVPEPGSFAILGIASGAIMVYRRRKQPTAA